MGKHLYKQYSFRCEDKLIEKLDYIAKKNVRNRNQEMIYSLQYYISNYEKIHGEIATGKSPGGGQENNGN